MSIRPLGLLPEDGRNNDELYTFEAFRAMLRGPKGDGADLTLFTGPMLEQPVGWCTYNTVAAAMTTLRAARIDLGFVPSQRYTYQLALRLDRAHDFPGFRVEDLPPLQDKGSRILTVVKTMNKYGVVPMGAPVTAFGRRFDSDCGPAELGEEDLTLADVEKGHKNLIVGAYEITGAISDVRLQMMLSLESGRSLSVGTWVDTRFQEHKGRVFLGKCDRMDPDGGGHCMEVIAYKWENGTRYWKIKNSWGADWADRGYVWVTDEFVDQFRSVFSVDVSLED